MTDLAQLVTFVVEALQYDFRLLVEVLHAGRKHGGLEFLHGAGQAVILAELDNPIGAFSKQLGLEHVDARDDVVFGKIARRRSGHDWLHTHTR